MQNTSHLNAGESGTDINKPVGTANSFQPTGELTIAACSCLTCELKLRAPKSIARGRGPTCHRRHKAAQTATLAAACSVIATTSPAAAITGGQR